ncbi:MULTISPECIES: SDR family oxidoreductase [unclassified Variovorax]|uniref:SDR family oxidoreductase n=1 Tax=unclassified Variovorax TaxID=663243 RepID=UPI003ED1294B
MVQGVAQDADAALLAGRCAIVAMPGLALGAALARGLRRHGARVVEIDVAPGSRADAEAAIGDASREAGGADLVVHAGATPAALASRPLEALSAEQWHSAVHRSMLTSLYFLQAVHRQQREAGGATVVVGPSTALVGAAGLVALITLAEAQRTLVKSAARQWGRHGMRLNWVGVGAQRYAPSLADAALPPTPELGPPPPALGRVPEAEAEVADVIAWLGSDGARGVTGASFNLDGGDWMVP